MQMPSAAEAATLGTALCGTSGTRALPGLSGRGNAGLAFVCVQGQFLSTLQLWSGGAGCRGLKPFASVHLEA
jgi:hypothetical protein